MVKQVLELSVKYLLFTSPHRSSILPSPYSFVSLSFSPAFHSFQLPTSTTTTCFPASMPSIACSMQGASASEGGCSASPLWPPHRHPPEQPKQPAIALRQSGRHGFTCANQLGGGGRRGRQTRKPDSLSPPARPRMRSGGVTMKRQTLFWSDIFKVAAPLWEGAGREEEISPSAPLSKWRSQAGRQGDRSRPSYM